jgi:VWFA-related protein
MVVALSCASAQNPVTLRTTTTLVQLSVVAHDSKGRAVTDLKKEDFEVFDNGKQQEIAVFSAETAAPATEPAPLNAFPEDTATPASKPRGNAVILLDYLNSGYLPAMWARTEIVRLLDNFDPAGRVALWVLDDNGIRPIGDFGANRNALLSNIASVIGKPSICNDNMDISEAQQCATQDREYRWMQRELKSLGALDSLADRLSFLAGRKALIWVSTATNVKDQLARARLAHATPELDAETERVLEKLNNADVALYPVDSCGLGGGCRSHPEAMDDYAARTGGVAVHGLNALDISMRNALEDIQFTYSLAFYPPQEGARTDFHRLKVQVKRPGIALKYKQGYSLETPATATAASLAPPIPGAEARAAAVAGALAATQPEIPPAVAPNAAASMLLPYFYTAPNVALVDLVLEIPTTDLKLQPHAQLTVDAVASRPDGGVSARFTGAVKFDFAPGAPYRYEHQFRLAPGAYNVRVAFGFGEEASGKLELPLTIDAWDGQHLALSGIALARESRKLTDVASNLETASLEGRKALIARSVEIVPTGSSRFQRSDPCLAFLEIYEPLLTKPNPPKISLQVRVLDRQTGDQKVDSGVFAVDSLVRAGEQAVPISLTVPIATLGPGGYRLEVKAISGSNSVVRAADFDVE